MKTKVLVESFGIKVKLVLEENQSIEAKNIFANLAWLCLDMVPVDCESFIVSREKLASCVKSFRAVNPNQARRGKGLWKQSPFEFRLTNQHINHSVIDGSYSTGEYQDTAEEREARRFESLTNSLQGQMVGITFNSIAQATKEEQ